MGLKKNLDILKESDIYSLLMFALYRINNIPEYSTLSELCYILDKKNLLQLCEYFGGLTIRIPTISELESVVYALLMYESINIDKKDYMQTIDELQLDSNKMKQVKSIYSKLCDILDTYEFTTR